MWASLQLHALVSPWNLAPIPLLLGVWSLKQQEKGKAPIGHQGNGEQSPHLWEILFSLSTPLADEASGDYTQNATAYWKKEGR